MSDTLISDLIHQHLPAKIKRTRSGISFNCPMCRKMGEPRDDTKMRGGIKIESDGSFVYHCFNCRFSTGYSPDAGISKKCKSFLETLGVPIEKIPLDLRLNRKSISLEDRNRKDEQIIPETFDFRSAKLPPNSETIDNLIEQESNDPDFLDALSYLQSRGSRIIQSSQYYWSPWPKLSMNKRIIIPFCYKGKIVGWTARYASNIVPGNKGKYYSEIPENYMYNMDLLESDLDSIVLVEGIFDAISIGGVAALRNELNDFQTALLKRSRKKIIVVPDRNQAGQSLVDIAIENGFSVSIPVERSSTFDDLAIMVKRFGVLYSMEQIYNNVLDSPDAIRMKFKVWYNSR